MRASAKTRCATLCLLWPLIGCQTLWQDIKATGRRPPVPKPWLSNETQRREFAALFRQHWEERERRVDRGYRAKPEHELSGPTQVLARAGEEYTWTVSGADFEHLCGVNCSVETSRGVTEIKVRGDDLIGFDSETFEILVWTGDREQATEETGDYAVLRVTVREWKEPPAADAQLNFSGPDSITPTAGARYSWEVQATGLSYESNVVVEKVEQNDVTRFQVDAADASDLETIELTAWKGPREVALNTSGQYAQIEVKVLQVARVTGTFQLLDDLDAEKYFGATFAKSFFCMRLRVANAYDFPVRVDAGSIELRVFYVSREEPEQKKPSVVQPSVVPTSPDTMLIDYEGVRYQVWPQPRVPMNFTAVINTIRFDQRHDSRSVLISLLRSAGVIAAGASGFGGVGDSYGEVLSFIQGPVVKELEALLLADLVQNLAFINEHALHESIVIPPRDGVEKYVFLPRGDILGIWSLELPVRVMYVEEAFHALSGSVITEQRAAETSTPGSRD